MKKKNPNLCHIKGCNEPTYLTYYGHKVCLKHWSMECTMNSFSLKSMFRIPVTAIKPHILHTLKDIQ